ncbi:hypothetical protein Tco_0538680 [Tanacetum coccineum]
MTAPSTTSTNDANTASPQVSATSPNVNAASLQVSTASVSDNIVYAFMVESPNGSNVLHQDLEQIHEDDLEVMDLKWQLSLLSVRGKKECRAPRSKEGQFRNQDNTKKQGNNEDKSSKAIPKKLDLSYSDLDEFKESEFKGYGPEKSEQESNVVCDKKSDNSKENLISLWPKEVNTARSYIGQVNAVRGKPQHADKGFVDSGCSRHMTGNIAYLLDFKEFDGGYVAFGGWVAAEYGSGACYFMDQQHKRYIERPKSRLKTIHWI